MSNDLVKRTLKLRSRLGGESDHKLIDEIVRALAETHEWKQAAEVEAMVRREAHAEIARLREALELCRVELAAQSAEIERLTRERDEAQTQMGAYATHCAQEATLAERERCAKIARDYADRLRAKRDSSALRGVIVPNLNEEQAALDIAAAIRGDQP